jgi:hypothetical protein
MITATDRQGLRSAIKQWSQRKNIPDDVLNDFIEISLSRANRALRIPSLEGYAVLPISSTGLATLPDNYLEAKSVDVLINGATVNLERKSIQEVDSVSNTTLAGATTPMYFARFMDSLRIAPWGLGEDSTLNLYYFLALPALATDQSTNWFTQYCADVLLYGALSELCSYTRDVEGVMLWNKKFDETINLVQSVEDRAAWAGSTLAVSLQGSQRFG